MLFHNVLVLFFCVFFSEFITSMEEMLSLFCSSFASKYNVCLVKINNLKMKTMARYFLLFIIIAVNFVSIVQNKIDDLNHDSRTEVEPF